MASSLWRPTPSAHSLLLLFTVFFLVSILLLVVLLLLGSSSICILLFLLLFLLLLVILPFLLQLALFLNELVEDAIVPLDLRAMLAHGGLESPQGALHAHSLPVDLLEALSSDLLGRLPLATLLVHHFLLSLLQAQLHGLLEI